MRQVLNWFRRSRLEGGLDRELSFHLERRTNDFIQEGLSPQEARRQAILELGGVTQIREEVRDVWLARWLRDFLYDLRFSSRSFRKTPSFTVAALLSLALGIGATSAIYSLVNQVLLHSLPVHDPQRLVLIDWQGDQVAGGFGSWNLLSYPICRDLDARKELFDGVFCRALAPANVATTSESRPAVLEIISGNYFSVLGVGAALGQVLTSDDDRRAKSNPVAVVSYDFWKTQLGGAPDVVGRKILVNRNPFTIIGVAAATFRGIDVGEVPALWVPASMAPSLLPGFNGLQDRRTRWMQVLGRLKNGRTLQETQAGVQPWFKAMLEEDMRRPGFPVITEERRQRYRNSYLTLTAAPQGHSGLRRRLLQPLWVLFAVTAVLLGLACLNVSGLMLARGSAREREITTRLALGASRNRLGRQLMTDSLMIALTGGVLGIALAQVAIRVLVALLPSSPYATGNGTALHTDLDLRVLLFALAASLVAGVVSGLAPAWQAGRRSLISSLRERGGTSFSGVRLRKVIVTAQIALTLVLVAGAALFVRTLDSLTAKGPGFTTASLVSFSIDGERSGYPKQEANRLIRRIDEAVRNSPVIQAAGLAAFPLLTGGSWNDPMTIQADRRIPTERDVNLNAVTPAFFETLGIKIIAGRNFTDHDRTPPGVPGWRFAIVNEAFVKRYLSDHNPIGVRIGEGSGPDAKPNIEIVGVVSNFSYRGIREDSEQVFFPYQGEGSATVYARVRGSADSSVSALRAIVREIDPTLPVVNLRTVEEQVDRSLNTERMLATLSSGFGSLALLLSLVGLYGVMSFVVTQRTREIGIRLALGAGRGAAIWLVLRDALTMLLCGVAIGLPVVWALGRLVESQLYDVKPFDPLVITLAVIAICSAGLVAAFAPARRASGVDPTDALRAE